METFNIDKELEKLFPSIKLTDDEIAYNSVNNKKLNESDNDNETIIKTDLSIDEYMKKQGDIEITDFYNMIRNKV